MIIITPRYSIVVWPGENSGIMSCIPLSLHSSKERCLRVSHSAGDDFYGHAWKAIGPHTKVNTQIEGRRWQAPVLRLFSILSQGSCESTEAVCMYGFNESETKFKSEL